MFLHIYRLGGSVLNSASGVFGNDCYDICMMGRVVAKLGNSDKYKHSSAFCKLDFKPYCCSEEEKVLTLKHMQSF